MNEIINKGSAILLLILMSGCSFGIISETRTLEEPPFITEKMAGSVPDASRCVGRFWQDAAVQMGLSWNLGSWNVLTDHSKVRVQGPGAGTPPTGLVIEFYENNGTTIASAHVHRIFPEDDPRRTVTYRALKACSLAAL
jgi:hypothetical protein